MRYRQKYSFKEKHKELDCKILVFLRVLSALVVNFSYFIYYLVRNMAVVEIYTDGSARGNPGPGGYGAILKYGKHEKELSQGYRRTTNNRMELLAVIVALESLTKDGLDVDVYSDSKYVVEAVNQKWVFGWQKKGFKGKKNPDLWQRFLKVYPKHHVKFHWIKGHNEHYYNERCDVLATTAADGGGLLIDHGFEAAAAGKELL